MFDFASILIWLIAVVTVTIGATLSAEEDREHQQRGNYVNMCVCVYECMYVYVCMYTYIECIYKHG
jgi:glucose uptake protein GlcU